MASLRSKFWRDIAVGVFIFTAVLIILFHHLAERGNISEDFYTIVYKGNISPLVLPVVGSTEEEPFLFFIYDWPEDVVDRWPTHYSNDHDQERLAFTPDFKANFGCGMVKNRDRGLYHTHQYSLFMTLYHRLLESPYRTNDPEKARLFFVPFDLGMDSSANRSNGLLQRTHCPTQSRIITLLKNSPYFHREAGADHFLLHSINQLMLHFTFAQCRELYRLCYNCTKLSIDVFDESVYSELTTMPENVHRWVSVPFPSNYHYSSDVKYPPPWVYPTLHIDTLFRDRPYALALMVSTKVTAAKQRALRKLLIQKCAAYASSSTTTGTNNATSAVPVSEPPAIVTAAARGKKDDGFSQKDRCLLINLSSHSSMTKILLQDPASAHVATAASSITTTTSTNSTTTGTIPATGSTGPVLSYMNLDTSGSGGSIDPYTKARLCLMPGGDFPTRKGILDALLAGCVPVTVELFAAQKQWPWHWGSVDAAMNCTVYIPREEVVRNPDEVFHRLVQMSMDTAFMRSKLLAIAKIGRRMQYDFPHDSMRAASAFNSMTTAKANAESSLYNEKDYMPPAALVGDIDAVDILLDALLKSRA